MSNDEIIEGPVVAVYIMGTKRVDDEILMRQITVTGDDAQGYQASFDEYFMPNRHGGMTWEYYETLLHSGTYQTAKSAHEAVRPFAEQQTDKWFEEV